MSDPVDITLSELLASRLAHEMVGPLGAVNNGLELVEELGPEDTADAQSLIRRSARAANGALMFYRAAYGRSGNSLNSIAEVREIAARFFHSEDNCVLHWPLPPVLPSLRDGDGKAILLLAEVARDALPRGGTVTIGMHDKIEFTADGKDAGIPPDLRSALEGAADVESLTPRNVHGYLARAVFARQGWTLEYEQEEGLIRILARLS